MVKQFLILAILVSNLTSAQTDYDQQMSDAFQLWKKGKITEASTKLCEYSFTDFKTESSVIFRLLL